MSVTTREVLTGGVHVAPTARQAGAAAAEVAARAILDALARRGRARVIFASAPSQEAMLATLGQDPRIDWSNVTSLHMDEYLGLPRHHPQAFGQWLEDRVPPAAHPGLQRIDPEADPAGEAARYAALVAAEPVDVTLLGIGVNGHVAFNEPDVARFDDDELVRLVQLDETSRQQQVDEGLFPELAAVPTHALTMTVPALTAAGVMVATVLGSLKAPAVARALNGPVSPECPASVLRMHPSASMHLDAGAAALLGADDVGSAPSATCAGEAGPAQR